MKKGRQLPCFAGEAEADKLMQGSMKNELGEQTNENENGENEAHREKSGSAEAYSIEERACLCERIELLSRELEHYRNMALERCMEEDLAAIREIDPKVEGLEELGSEYVELIRAGVSAPIAYRVINASRIGKNQPTMGDVRAASDSEDIPFTYAQAMAMSPAQVASSYDKLRRSMRHWK